MNIQVVIAGLGGEGIVFMTMVLAQGAFDHGYPVISTETHGMAMRGGSVSSQLKIGDFQSPMIRFGEADWLIATCENEARRNFPYLKKGGRTVIDSPSDGPNSIDARGIAHQLGSPLAANLALLGFSVARMNGFSLRIFEETIASLSPPAFSHLNSEAFKKGFEIAEERMPRMTPNDTNEKR